MGFLSGLFGKGKMQNTNRPENRKESNTLRYPTNDQVERMFSVARCENGVVYCCSNTEFVIGSYEEDESGKIIVWNDDHLCRIGEIQKEDCEIWLTRADSYIQRIKIMPNLRMPSPLVLPVAKWYGNYIVDIDTRQTVASFEGDAIAGAAAFVCLTYEVLTKNRYHDFFSI